MFSSIKIKCDSRTGKNESVERRGAGERADCPPRSQSDPQVNREKTCRLRLLPGNHVTRACRSVVADQAEDSNAPGFEPPAAACFTCLLPTAILHDTRQGKQGLWLLDYEPSFSVGYGVLEESPS